MKITLEKLSDSQVKLAITVEGSTSQAIYDRTVQKIVRSVQIPGFRKGKAPHELVLRQTGMENIKASVFEELVEESVKEILKTHSDLHIVGEFQLEKQASELLQEFQAGQDFNFALLVDVLPEFELTYKGLKLQVVKAEPDLASTDRTLHEYRLRKSTLVPIEDRPAQLGDVAVLDMQVYDVATGSELEFLRQKDLQVDLDPDSFIPEVVHALVGTAVGETREITAPLPKTLRDAEDSEQVRYVVTLNDLKMRELPPLDDEFARSISEKQTMAELRQFLDQRAVEQAQRQTERNTQLALYDALIAQVKVEPPQSMVQKEVDFLVRQRLEYLHGQVDEKLFKQLLNRETLQEIRKMAEPEAIARVKRSMALAKIAALEDITVEPEEFNQGMEQVLPHIDRKKVDLVEVAKTINSELLVEKVVAWLLAQSSIEYVPAKPDPHDSTTAQPGSNDPASP
jgi:trigger factor